MGLSGALDVINDGEASKPSYATYVTERLDGFGGDELIKEVSAWPVCFAPQCQQADCGLEEVS